ncbi:transposase [Streptomyces viridosporus]
MVTARRPCPPAPGPLEDYAAQFDGLFSSLAQRWGFREYLTGLLLPRDRNKTLTALAGAEPVAGLSIRRCSGCSSSCPNPRGTPSESTPGALSCCGPMRRPPRMRGGVLVIDDSGDRKDGTTTAHVGRQRLGRYGKTDNAVVTVATLWADERLYYPLYAVPYTPAHHFAGGRSDPAFRTKWRIAAELAGRARAAGFPFRAAVADGAYGDLDDFRCELHTADVPFVIGLDPL